MEAALWVCLSLLCLQGSFLQLTRGADCTGTSPVEDCVNGQTTGGKKDGFLRLMPSAPRETHTQKKPQRWKDDNILSAVPLDRQEREFGKHSSLPGSFSTKGFPNTLIQVQTERARRHLGQSGTKKKNKPKSRVGSFSLLSNNPGAAIQVTRVRRQLQKEKKKGKPRGRTGAYSAMDVPDKPEPLGQRHKRSPQKKKQTKRVVCS
ncbi:uncharacterized protein si:dkey-12l12.1 isoform X2 [Oncorhynchus tshawytscha]|uniref:uncharacterized protein si:dkey-12l12.1 isoform X2 n=1 Tax=Oncorhynchus tshawytscha TaxID=74940 RepID=UPI000D0A87B5|nr:uncharacterized protein si:dkey-12l12.1 isoform X2 [Oncorhynchus tshawytscha]